MKPKNHILIDGSVILSVGLLKAAKDKKPLSLVVEGSLVLVILMSLLESLDPMHLGKVASALSTLATITVLIAELPDVLSSFIQQKKGK